MTRFKFMATAAVIMVTAMALLYLASLQTEIITLNMAQAKVEQLCDARVEELTRELADAQAQVEFLSREGRYDELEVAICEITCYSPFDCPEECGFCHDGNREYTATGARPNPYPENWFTVAVDPAVIPLGSMVWVENFGWGVAEDTGGGVVGYHVDVCVGSHEFAEEWGLTWGIVLWEKNVSDAVRHRTGGQ